MGLFTALLTLPLAPVRGVAWVVDQVATEADRQLYDEQAIRRALLELELDYDDGKLDREELEQLQDELLGRLAVSQARAAALSEQEGHLG
jgi:hypothetical protein